MSDVRAAGRRRTPCSRPTRTDAADARPRAAAAARAAAGALLADAEELDKHGDAAAGIEVGDELPGEVDLCLVLGGDGTILQALRAYAGHRACPSSGSTSARSGSWPRPSATSSRAGLERAFSGDFEVMTLPGLEADGRDEKPVALNDVSFIRRPHGRVAELSYRLGGEEVGHVRCDGLVAATPAGSTGYNLANQGPILAWGVKGYVVSFIAPHTLTARALVVAPDDVLHVLNGAGRDPVDVVLDGEPGRRAGKRRGDRGPLPRGRRAAGAAAGLELLPPDPREVRPPGH